jgi:hypothetical protein
MFFVLLMRKGGFEPALKLNSGKRRIHPLQHGHGQNADGVKAQCNVDDPQKNTADPSALHA